MQALSSRSSITSAFEDKFDNVMQALSSRSSQSFPPQNPSPSTKECMDIVLTFPGFEEGSRNYCHALDIFLKKQARENFMVPTSDSGETIHRHFHLVLNAVLKLIKDIIS
ncbi:hypothetical protein HanLR1_Chr16g0619831 [Helianthus annuus]|nr:hypothetical protein HanLR1_Chr16g0619831 [Helianthus annuus]